MSQQQRLIQLPLAGAILLCLLAIAFFATQKHPAKSEATGGVSKHVVKKNPDEARKYWTNDRMRAVKPAPMPHTNDLKPGKKPASDS